ncbi:chalcone isomerase family protein [Shewanella indica]|uniref:chalcone isomerase family protein n=1 Tax=Shewanella indica TaxID=768528 RepID=UPI001CFCFD5A|nr:chalcone isomerase family protein [Shewanella indica]
MKRFIKGVNKGAKQAGKLHKAGFAGLMILLGLPSQAWADNLQIQAQTQAQQAQALSQEQTPEPKAAQVEPSKAELASFREVGRGEMDWWFITLYRARLLTPDGSYQPNSFPQQLEIQYYRDIPASRLLEATKHQWLHLGYDREQISAWLALLEEIWPDVEQGDRLSFVASGPQRGHFLFNDKPLAAIVIDESASSEHKRFADAFLAIWLSERSSRPQLRAQLIGEQACKC